MITREKLTELAQLLARATHGPMKVDRYDNSGGEINYQVQSKVDPFPVIASFVDIENPRAKWDAKLFVRATEVLPELIELAREALGAREEPKPTPEQYAALERIITRFPFAECEAEMGRMGWTWLNEESPPSPSRMADWVRELSLDGMSGSSGGFLLEYCERLNEVRLTFGRGLLGRTCSQLWFDYEPVEAETADTSPPPAELPTSPVASEGVDSGSDGGPGVVCSVGDGGENE
jgi:hypothetical protein